MKTDRRSSNPVRGGERGRTAARPPEEQVRKRDELKRSATDVYRAAILDAAERVFGQRSFRDAKIADIASGAGMASGTLYNYFDSKEAIFRALVERLGDELLARLQTLAGSAELEPLPKLIEMVQLGLSHFHEHRQLLLVITQLGALAEVGLEEVAGDSVEKVQKRIFRIFENVVKEARDDGELRDDFEPADLVNALFGIAHGQLRSSLAATGRRSITGKSASFFDLFLHGASKRR